jgi:hypothetical protein
MIKNYCIACFDSVSNKTGCFFYDIIEGQRVASSPIFSNLTEFYKWTKEQGFKEHSANRVSALQMIKG